VLRFGAFEVDLQEGELRKSGLRVKLQEQPFQVLVILLERPGKIVTREELRQKLWPSDTFVDFDHSLNSAVKKLREALGDQPDNPRFVETIHRRGYRFLAPVKGQQHASEVQADLQGLGQEAEESKILPTPPSQPMVARVAWFKKRSALTLIATATIFVTVLASFTANVGGWRERLVGGSGTGSNTDQIQSIAVLPLANLSRDPGQDYFADGMTEALITDLAQIGSVRVISRTSVMHYKGTGKTVPEIGRELKVDAVVEGAAQLSGGRVRITAQLIRAATDQHMWAQTYEGDLSDILTVQSRVAQSIANEIKIRLPSTEHGHLSSSGRVDPQAYQSYLEGRYYWNMRTEEGINKGIEYFHEAIERDPQYALAYAGLAESYVAAAGHRVAPAKEALSKAKAAALKALEIDEGLAEAHIPLAVVRAEYDLDLTTAEKEYRRAIELNPNSATAHQWYAEDVLAPMGRHEEAIAEMKRALELDPLSLAANFSFGYILYLARENDQAMAQLQKTLEMYKSFPVAHSYLGRVYVQKRMFANAIEEFQSAAMLSGDHPFYLAWLGYGYAVAGRTSEADKILGQLTQLSLRRYVPPYDLAATCAGLGRKDQALKWLQKAYEERASYFHDINVEPVFDSLRSDPRFQDLVHRVGLPQ
jgi:TolB-like protein/DNA-binding winged helix-turn-helix (wHTH) protein/Tfp pilus assembly protein PilF